MTMATQVGRDGMTAPMYAAASGNGAMVDLVMNFMIDLLHEEKVTGEDMTWQLGGGSEDFDPMERELLMQAQGPASNDPPVENFFKCTIPSCLKLIDLEPPFVTTCAPFE